MAAFNKNIHLCPGTFLTLLMKAKNDVATAHEKEKGISYSNSDDDVFAALLRVSFQNFEVKNEGSFHTFTNQYKQCGKEVAKSIPLADENAIEEIRKAKLNVGFTLRMQQFIKTYLKETELNWLINALVDLMEADPLISDVNLWYMGASFQRETSTLKINDSIYVDWFLASVWYYIITECKHNRIEKEIYDSWFAKENNDQGYDFVSGIGKKAVVNYKIQWFETPGTLLESVFGVEEEDDEEDEDEGIAFNLDVCPEIGEKPPLLLFAIKEDILDEEGDAVKVYLDNVYENNYMVQTFYYEQRAEFEKFYVRNNLSRKVGNYSRYYYSTVDNEDAITVAARTKHVIISGTGGLGKSMMMHYFLLQGVKGYDESGLLPLLVRLKDFGTTTSKLKDYLFEEFEALSEGGMDEDIFEGLLKQGKLILLLDGMDEIQTAFRGVFEVEISKFVKLYKNNIIIISSRPNGNFRGLGGSFEEYLLQPLTQPQAIDMIKRLDFSRTEVKEKFLEKLENEYYRTHRSFAENPLLLTIMLTTFAAFGRINSDSQKVHLFYEEAFVALAQKHDANKMGGAVNREFSTGFSTNRLAEYMARFCAYSYMEKKTNFTKTEFDYYFNAAKKKLCSPIEEQVTADDFMFDLQHNVCLIYPENLKWEFTHRSFQEYFCARFFNENAFDEQLYGIGMKLEERGQHNGDLTFRMLYDMNPTQIELFILLPFLENLFSECDKKNGYKTFLEKMYSTIYYIAGETDGNYSTNDPDSFLFGFIVLRYGLPVSGDYFDGRWDSREEFVDEEYLEVTEHEGDGWNEPYYESTSIKRRDDLSVEYLDYCDDDPCGYECSFEVETVLSNEEEYEEFIKELESQECPIRIQYESARALMEEWQEKKASRNKKTSFMDMF